MQSPYTSHMYHSKRLHLVWRAGLIIDTLLSALPSFNSLIDCGCSVGELVGEFLKKSVDAYGLDAYVPSQLLRFPEERLLRADLTKPLLVTSPFSVVLCCEVLGVVPVYLHPIVVRNLVNMCSEWLVVCADPKIRATCDSLLLHVHRFHRCPALEQKIRDKLESYKHRLAVKAFYNGVSVWKPCKMKGIRDEKF